MTNSTKDKVCEMCGHWGQTEEWEGRCGNPKISGAPLDGPITFDNDWLGVRFSREDECDEQAIICGPRFGCIHWEGQ